MPIFPGQRPYAEDRRTAGPVPRERLDLVGAIHRRRIVYTLTCDKTNQKPESTGLVTVPLASEEPQEKGNRL